MSPMLKERNDFQTEASRFLHNFLHFLLFKGSIPSQKRERIQLQCPPKFQDNVGVFRHDGQTYRSLQECLLGIGKHAQMYRPKVNFRRTFYISGFHNILFHIDTNDLFQKAGKSTHNPGITFSGNRYALFMNLNPIIIPGRRYGKRIADPDPVFVLIVTYFPHHTRGIILQHFANHRMIGPLG
ncbi:MAG: hypothetical protein II337_02895 [Clostridia bacterium]|nr:hypothetical protein [Clostridia bacterium]